MRPILLTLVVLGFMAGPSFAATNEDPNRPLWPLTPICIERAAEHYNIKSDYLYAVLYNEGGKVGEIQSHANGEQDIGPWQINTRWINVWSDELKSLGFTAEILRDNGCANAWVGAWRVAAEISDHGVWDGLGRYHSGTPERKLVYQERLKRSLFKNSKGEWQLKKDFDIQKLLRSANSIIYERIGGNSYASK